jgi:hypothetical protein
VGIYYRNRVLASRFSGSTRIHLTLSFFDFATADEYNGAILFFKLEA